jgi:hypothetical protein
MKRSVKRSSRRKRCSRGRRKDGKCKRKPGPKKGSKKRKSPKKKASKKRKSPKKKVSKKKYVSPCVKLRDPDACFGNANCRWLPNKKKCIARSGYRGGVRYAGPIQRPLSGPMDEYNQFVGEVPPVFAPNPPYPEAKPEEGAQSGRYAGKESFLEKAGRYLGLY